MKLTLGRDAEQIIKDQLNSRRFADAESVVLAGLKSLAARGPDEFAPGELAELIANGEKSIERDGVLDGDEAFKARKDARNNRRTGAA